LSLSRKSLLIISALGLSLLWCQPTPLYAATPSKNLESKLVPPAKPGKNIFAKKRGPQVEVVGDKIEYLRNEKKIIAKGNVVLRYKAVELSADIAEVNTETRQAIAKGHVIVFRNGIEAAKGDEVHFNFGDSTGSFPDGRIIHLPWFATGEEIEQVKKNVKVIHHGSFTTCNLEHPHYEVTAKKRPVRESLMASSSVCS